MTSPKVKLAKESFWLESAEIIKASTEAENWGFRPRWVLLVEIAPQRLCRPMRGAIMKCV